ncbi:unnamed protein product [Penicillium olsonii]|nr:unnamed protein product [Penicillium olsonii]CAG7931740.1 unnamed protein product [Penicillium olsonii]
MTDYYTSQFVFEDGHNDFAIYLRYSYKNHLYQRNFTEPFKSGDLGQHADLDRLTRGRVGGTFWCAFAFCPRVSEEYTPEYFSNSYQTANAELDTLRRIITAYPDRFSLPHDSSDVESIVHAGKIASPLCIEGLHIIGDSIATLRNYYALGVRYATLTHNCHNSYADAAMVDLLSGGSAAAEPYCGGVSPLGQKLIKEMNRMGMMVDLSHTSFDTMRDVLGGSPEKGWNGSLAPVMFSHSSAYALCLHPRNVPDDVLYLVKNTNSVVMVTFATDFNSCREPKYENRTNGLPEFYPPNSTITHVVEHIRYIGDLIGYDHVGLGSDFDGIFDVPRGMEDVSKFPDLVAEMILQGVSDDDVSKVVGQNILRVWRNVDAVAERLKANGAHALEDDIPWEKRPNEPENGGKLRRIE